MTTTNVLKPVVLIEELANIYATKGYSHLRVAFFATDLFSNSILDAFGLTYESDCDLVAEKKDLLASAIEKAVDEYEISILTALVECFYFEEALDIFMSGDIIVYDGCHDMESVAREYVDQVGESELLYISNNGTQYIDEDSLLHDLYCGGEIQEYYYQLALEKAQEDGESDHVAWKYADEYEITTQDEQNYLEAVLDSADGEWLVRYFDYEAYGRDLGIEGTFLDYNNGMFQVLR